MQKFFVKLDGIRLTDFGLRYRKTLYPLLFSGSFWCGFCQGLPASPQPLMLRMPAATPHLPSLSAVARPLLVGYAVCPRCPLQLAVGSAHPHLTNIVYHRPQKKSIPFRKFFQEIFRKVRRNTSNFPVKNWGI